MKLSDHSRSVIINHLLERQRGRPDERLGVGFIYCNYKEQEKQTIQHLTSSILHQLAVQAPEISQTLMDSFKELHQKKIQRPTRDVLAALQIIIPTYHTVYIVIDALDECTESDGRRSELVQYLKNMPPNLKILYTSRELPDIERLFPDASKLYIHALETDIEKYLKGRIDKSPRLRKHVQGDPSLLQAIMAGIVGRVHGMSVFSSSISGRRMLIASLGFFSLNYMWKYCPRSRIEDLFGVRWKVYLLVLMQHTMKPFKGSVARTLMMWNLQNRSSIGFRLHGGH